MRTLKHLEKKKFVWFLIGLSIVFFLFRLPSLIEPNWYGDEGIYQVISLAMNSGRDLYAEVWDNKPPLLYVTYALFAGDQFSIRLLSLLFGIGSMIVFFFLSRTLLKNDKAAGSATVVFTLLFATPYLEGNIANAENFMLLFVLSAAFFIYSISNETFPKPLTISPKLFFAGFLLGTAFLFKIVALFDFAAFCLFLLVTRWPVDLIHKRFTFVKKVKKIGRFSLDTVCSPLCGFLLPIAIAFFYFTISGTLIPFIQSAFFGNVSYVGYANYFIIPQGFLILKLSLFIIAITVVLLKRNRFPKHILFITLWLIFTVFSAFFSQRPYTHYILVMLPTFCLFVGLFFTQQTRNVRLVTGAILLIVMFIATQHFQVYGIGKTVAYYQNALSFLTGHKTVNDYQSFFDPETPRDYELVSYINTRTSKSDQIFIWGDSPQIYYLAHKLPLNKYTVSYHILQEPYGIQETQAAIDKIQPKFIITLSEAPPMPFQLPQYVGKYGIKGSTIYERTY